MSLPVIYCKQWKNAKKIANQIGDCFILTPNNWDDYHYKTTFDVKIYRNNEEYNDLSRKILFEEQDNIYASSDIFDKYCEDEEFIDIEIVRKNHKFISLGYDYKELMIIFPENFNDILKILNDVIYLEKFDSQSLLLRLKETKGFNDSLCRDQSARKILEEGNSLLYGEELSSERFKFKFSFNIEDREYDYDFNFVKNDLPYRINILIGKNGSGKSQTLLNLSNHLIFSKNSEAKVSPTPNFIENLMVVAYNPYENFYVNIENDNLDIEYKYLGLKKRKTYEDLTFKELNENQILFPLIDILKKLKKRFDPQLIFRDKNKIIELLIEKTDFPKEEINKAVEILEKIKNETMIDLNYKEVRTFNSFIDIFNKDYNNHKNEIELSSISYRNQVINYLKKAFELDTLSLGLKLIDNAYKESYQAQGFNLLDDFILFDYEEDFKKLIKEIILESFEQKLYIISKEKSIPLSSGQQTFVDLVLNILSIIEKNSLILIDEPENTLHPNIEIDFFNILKEILDEFDSFSIIATHSPIFVREVPKEYVKVIHIDKEDNQPIISTPIINTFGANISSISNYVFEDIFAKNKPYKDWLNMQKSNYLTFEQFKEKYEDRLGYDFLLQCKNFWKNK